MKRNSTRSFVFFRTQTGVSHKIVKGEEELTTEKQSFTEG